MRIGQGFDVHRLKEGRALIIGGINIPFGKGLDGHSDADVLVHAIIDSLLGAAALGNIGHPADGDDVGFFHIPAGDHDGGDRSKESTSLPGNLGHIRRSFQQGFVSFKFGFVELFVVYFSFRGERKVPKERPIRKKPTVSSLCIHHPTARTSFALNGAKEVDRA